MARNLSILLLVFSIATFLHGSSAQTRHVVGGSIGWTIPSGGAATYAAWAANRTFTVGDTLVFNFPTGAHDVAKVTKSAFDSCSGANALSTILNGPATVPLNETGEQYYICTFGTHCVSGQKLAVNVTRGSTSPSPAPQPSGTPPPPRASPVPSPTPTPSPRSSPRSAPAPGPSTPAATPPSSAATPPSSASTPPSSAATPPNPSTPSPAGAVSPPPQNSGAASLAAFGFFATLLSIVASFCF